MGAPLPRSETAPLGANPVPGRDGFQQFRCQDRVLRCSSLIYSSQEKAFALNSYRSDKQDHCPVACQ